MRTDKGTAVIADRLLCDDVDVGDYVKCTLPEIKWKTVPMEGSGIGGTVEMPLQGMADAMSMQIDLRTIGKGNPPILLQPGSRKLELRFNRNVVQPDGNIIRAGTKIYLTAMSAGISPGGVQRGSAMDGNASFSVLRYRWVEDGKELFLLDQFAETYRVNGVDYGDAYRI